MNQCEKMTESLFRQKEKIRYEDLIDSALSILSSVGNSIQVIFLFLEKYLFIYFFLLGPE